jgi:hypothetical protein
MAPEFEDLAVQLAGRRSAAEVRALWQRLAQPRGERPPFDPAELRHLPEPARRWLQHALVPGTPLYQAVALRMHGHIRIGRWLPFQAIQLHAPPNGYLWAAKAGFGPIGIRGYDSYADGTGRMRWRLFGLLPLIDSVGPDIDRSAAGRVALDAFTLPTSWLRPGVSWQSGGGEGAALAHWQVGNWALEVRLSVGPDGALRTLAMPRWAAPRGEPWGEYSCGGTLAGERSFTGVRIPTELRAGYFFRTPRWPEGEFFRATVTDAAFW